MTKAEKIELLYRKAKGTPLTSSQQEELRKYKVELNEGGIHVTKANIRDYVTAVDNGTKISFYDWCMNNLRADRRRKGGSAKEIAADNESDGCVVTFMAWLPWAMAIYWILDAKASIGGCIICAIIINLIIVRRWRRNRFFLCFILPIIIVSIVESVFH